VADFVVTGYVSFAYGGTRLLAEKPGDPYGRVFPLHPDRLTEDRGIVVRCNCADSPPTLGTERASHLSTCPFSALSGKLLAARRTQQGEPQMQPDPKQENSKATVGVEVPEPCEASEKSVVLWPHESPPGRCIHWPKTCAGTPTATYSKPCAHCAPSLYTHIYTATTPVAVTDEMVEAAARSYFAAVRVVSTSAWDDQPETVKVVYRQDARAILEAALPHIAPAIRNEAIINERLDR
jgi:hypothetical protein